MWRLLVGWLRHGVKDQVIITVDPKLLGSRRSRSSGARRSGSTSRSAAGRCGDEVRRWDLSGRWAYACETCQPPPP